jgi:iron complex outermembrane recepter protein
MASTTLATFFRQPRHRHSGAFSALALAALQAMAQSPAAPTAAAPAEADNTVRITITGSRAQHPASIAGFGDVPLSALPISASVITRGQLADAGISGLGDITRLFADITDAYNAPGYINQLAVRGYTLDNRSNFRRDGLPINAETAIGQANKQALELLKGTSGLQAGVSAPGGLVNFVVKRPTGHFRDASLSWSQRATTEAALDLGDRFGSDARFGWRLNAAAGQLEPQTNNSRSNRHLLALAVDGRWGATLVEVEVESSRQNQPSTPGFSLLGTRLPDAASIDPRTNLNNQAWTLPVVFQGITGSVRVTHSLSEQTELVATLMRQRLVTEDRIAFPFGCSAENVYNVYCSDGLFDLYDYRSEGERRVADAAQVTASTRQVWAGVAHRLQAGVLSSRQTADFNRQAFNWVGVGNLSGASVLPADPSLTDENTNRNEHSTELHLQDAINLTEDLTLWAGARHSRLNRSSVRTDGSRNTLYVQSFTTPWLAASWRPMGPASPMLYASAGEGVETEVTPNRARYVNAGEALPALKSRQFELGVKHRTGPWDGRAAAFDIRRPAWNDVLVSGGNVAQDDCSDSTPCRRQLDGTSHHRGLEAELEWRGAHWSLRGSGMWLRAQRKGSVNPVLNGLQPTNVPERSLKAQAAWSLPQVPGLTLLAFASHEGPRMVLPDNSVATPGWTRLDLGARYSSRWQGRPYTFRLNLDNATNRRAWQEAPYQFGHAYLYPLSPRTLRASLETRL